MPYRDKVIELAQNFLKDLEGINKVKPPVEAQKPRSAELAERIDAARGRPLFFHYIGSGRGNGPYVELQDGSVKLDLINGIGIHILGHAHPLVVHNSLEASLSDVVMQGNLQPGMEYLEMTEKLVEVASLGSNIKHAWLCQSGSMANENGLKICRQKMNGARMIISMTKAFAGRTQMMAEVTDNPAYRVGLPTYDEVVRVPFYDKDNPNSIEDSHKALKEIIEKHRGDIGCFIFEPMQGEGGYRSAPREFFVPLLETCKEEGIPIFLDEVQTFCRTGEFFAFQTLCLGEYVDVVSVAKSLQNAATLYTSEFNPEPGLISGTFSGSTVALKTGTAILHHLKSEGYMGPNGKISEIHKMFVGMLNELGETSCKGLISDAGGLGLMVAFTPMEGTKEQMLLAVKKLFENGLMCFGCGSDPYRIRFLLPAILERSHVDEAKSIIEKTFLDLKE
jgi:acetylornithine/N-succinyldiaminopimelate aminotransferase